MKLRTRLGLTLLALIVPFAIGLASYQARSGARAFEEGTAEQLVSRMESGERFRCEASPESWPDRLGRPFGRRPGKARGRGRPRRGPWARQLDVWAYDAHFESDNPSAPALPAELTDALGDEGDVASLSVPGGRGDARLVAVRMPWVEGPCAVVVVRRGGAPSRLFWRTLLPALGISALAVFIAVIAAGPIVRRIRTLTDAVRGAGVGGERPIELGGRDEIAQLAKAFEERRQRIRDQIEELERRDEALRRYIANTTHDVMIPVTVLQGHLSALERDAGTGKPLEAGRLAAALEECHYLASLLHNLNAAAKLEAGTAHAERHPMDLGDLVERVVGRHAPFARQRDVSLDFAIPESKLTALGDVTLVEQAVGNLIHNAVRYNRSGGHVAVVLEREGDDFALRVVDDGPGIPEDELARARSRGYRGNEARTRHPHGLGLGLSIVGDVVDRHGWQLGFAHPEEGGLRVTLRGALS